MPRLSLLMLLGLSILEPGCASAPQARKSQDSVYGPEPASTAIPSPTPSSAPALTLAALPPLPPPSSNYGPAPVELKPLVLVLGPGLVKGFAHAGVLEEVARAKIPIGAIIGTEMGALMGALYCQDRSANSLEWKTQKIKEAALLDRPMFGSGPVDGSKLESNLEDLFASVDGQTGLQCPVWITTHDTVSGTLRSLREGPLSRNLRMGFSSANRFKPLSDAGGNTLVAVTELKDLIREARVLASGPVVVVRLDSDTATVESLAGDADWVISVDTSGVPSDDFQKRRQAIFKGAAATRASLDRLRALAGMP